MAIYSRCVQCKRDQKVTSKTCNNCGAILGQRYSVKVRDAHTKKWKTKQVSSLSLAKKVEAKFKVQMLEGKLFDQRKPNEFSFSKYLDYAKQHKKSWKDDQSRWSLYIAGKGHDSNQGIQQILSDMQHLSPATRRHAFTLIRRVYNWHIQQGLWHQENPVKGIKLPRFDNRVSNILNQEQLKTFVEHLNQWENRRAALAILFAIYTGRRKGEIMGLEWQDISYDLQFITCRNTKNGETMSFPLNSSAITVLREARSLKESSEFVFCSSTGDYYYNGLSLAWNRLRKRLKREGTLDVTSIRFHDLRHTYASHLASSGQVDIYTLKTLLGHKDIALTERYSHLSNERLKKSTEVLDSIL
ncbi:site-specific integrase [Desulfogranum marinum]|uniref:tyrosine-type recombinase/integrase n=1 Tax=Desulfogranum marinum TaxID=453220 RepID=UPI0029C62B28|nr:site-specific integrase [Desulfogranum marinum]